jgi:hypothetical protein
MAKIILLAFLGAYCSFVRADLDQILIVFGFAFLALPTLNSWFTVSLVRDPIEFDEEENDRL